MLDHSAGELSGGGWLCKKKKTGYGEVELW